MHVFKSQKAQAPENVPVHTALIVSLINHVLSNYCNNFKMLNSVVYQSLLKWFLKVLKIYIFAFVNKTFRVTSGHIQITKRM